MGKSLILTLPPGIDIPDGTQNGDTFQAMATFRLLSPTAYGSSPSHAKPGKIELIEIDGELLTGNTDGGSTQDRTDINGPTPSPGLAGMFSGGS